MYFYACACVRMVENDRKQLKIMKKYFNACFSCYFLRFPFFFSICDEKDKKLVLTQKQMILTSERLAEHLFAGRNTQQVGATKIFRHS